MDFVLDASLALSWVFPDEKPEYSMQVRERLRTQSAVVPNLWSLELTNILALSLKRGRITQGGFEESLALLRSIPVRVDEATFHSAWGAILRLAVEHALTTYDAAYLELAQRCGIPLATLDDDLRRASRKAKVKLI